MAAVFPSGTKTLFQQTAAPTGWTKAISVDNYTLRVVNGATGGTVSNNNNLYNFTTIMADTTWTGTANGTNGPGVTGSTSAPAPAHTHGAPSGTSGTAAPVSFRTISPASPGFVQRVSGTTASSGSAGLGSHSHPFSSLEAPWTSNSTANFAIQYVDLILATKD